VFSKKRKGTNRRRVSGRGVFSAGGNVGGVGRETKSMPRVRKKKPLNHLGETTRKPRGKKPNGVWGLKGGSEKKKKRGKERKTPQRNFAKGGKKKR